MPAAHGDWQPYTGPNGGHGWVRIGPDGRQQIIYTRSRVKPGDHAPHAHTSGVGHHRIGAGGAVGDDGSGSGEASGMQSGHHDYGASHRMVHALRVAHGMIRRPHFVLITTIRKLIRLIERLSVPQIQQIQKELVTNHRALIRGESLREQAHMRV